MIGSLLWLLLAALPLAIPEAGEADSPLDALISHAAAVWAAGRSEP